MISFPQSKTYFIDKAQYEKFKDYSLLVAWFNAYPMLFDDDDISNAISQAKRGYHFHEWLSAILIFHSHGYYSLVEQYQFKKHQRKRKVLGKLRLSEEEEKILTHNPKQNTPQCPDLLVFKPDYSDWFLAEVKGASDGPRKKQDSHFDRIRNVTGKEISTIKLEYVK